MFRSFAMIYGARAVGGLALFLAFALPIHAQPNDDGALLAISIQQGQLTGGFMCYAAGDSTDLRNLPMSQKAVSLRGDMCRLANSDLINPDVIVFDVTTWSRKAIATLVTQIGRLEDPLNYDFATARIGDRSVLRIQESAEDEVLRESAFELGAGSYLLLKFASPITGSGS